MGSSLATEGDETEGEAVATPATMMSPISSRRLSSQMATLSSKRSMRPEEAMNSPGKVTVRSTLGSGSTCLARLMSSASSMVVRGI
jgi:hypothetical protein